MAKATTVSNLQVEQQKSAEEAIGSKMVRLAVSLQNSIKFTSFTAPWMAL